jgi:predicted ATPase
MLTLTGPGGTGKTRLAIEVASELVPVNRNGVFWVSLASVRDAGLVADTIGGAIGAHGNLAAHIAEREMLLVLDNFEQVVEAAPELPTLLEKCPNLRLLVTSRERLRVRGEVDYPVPPLADREAVDLFCLRGQVAPDETVAKLCRSLENLPLALELAAARASVLTPAQILVRLAGRLDLLKGGRDAEARQLTLRATIEWSHDLLTPDERGLFARLAVFRGGWTLEEAEAVAGADLETLESLADKSLIRHRDGRFTMLETIREYADERLESSGKAGEIRRGHAEFFLALVESAEPEIRRDSTIWLDRLEREHDNLRSALDWLEASEQRQDVLRFGGAVWRFWYMKGHLAEGGKRLEEALAADDLPTAARAKTLNGAAVMALNRGDAATTRRRATEALELHRALGDAWGAAYARFMLAQAANEEGDVKAAASLFEESLATFRGLGDDHYSWIAAFNLAIAIEDLGDVARAKALQEDNLHVARGRGDRHGEAHALTQLAMLAFQDERLGDASATLRPALRIFVELGSVLEIAVNLGRFAAILARTGRVESAAQLLAKSEALSTEIGAGVLSWAAERNARTTATISEQLNEAGLAEAEARGRAMTVDQAVALALGSTESR